MRGLGVSGIHLSPPHPSGSLGCCPLWGGGSVVDSLLVVAPIVCRGSVFCVILCAFSSFQSS